MCWWNSLQLLRLLADPGDDAGRTDQRGAEQIARRLRGPVLGDELLDIEIDRRRLDALAILHRRDHAIGKPRPGLAPAIFAAVDRGLMFRDHERALGKIEHLAFLELRSPTSDRGTNRNGHRHTPCAQSPNPDRRLAATWRPYGPSARRLAGPMRRAGCRERAASPSTRRSKAAGNCSNCPAPIAGEGPPLQPQAPRSGVSARRSIPRLRQEEPCLLLIQNSPPAVSKDQPNKPLFKSPVTFPTHPGLGVTKRFVSPCEIRPLAQQRMRIG